MPRELIMFRSHFEENGITAEWKALYRQLTDMQKDRLMKIVSLSASELKNTPWPDDLKKILSYYLIKYSDASAQTQDQYEQLSFLDDRDIIEK